MTLLPILDNHMHLNPDGRCLDAVKEFAYAGGTHIVLVSLPPWSFGIQLNTKDDYRKVFDKVLKISKRIQESENIKVFVVLGVHPAEITKYYGRLGLPKTIELMENGLEIASEYVKKGLAVGLKSGRPHYKVEEKIWEASNNIMKKSFELAKDCNCPVQVHTESATEETLYDLSKIAKDSGLSPDKVIKHFSPPMIKTCEKIGIFPSVLAGEDAIEKALSEGSRFMMETDYIDDLKRPGVVLGPKTVPRRTKQLISEWGEEVFWKIHKDNPEKVYNIEIEI